METVAERLKYWDERVADAEVALAYCIGQRILLLEQIMAEEMMTYADPLTHIKNLDRQYGGE